MNAGNGKNARAVSRAGRSGIEANPRTENQQLALPRNGGHLVVLQAGDGGAMEHEKNYSMRAGRVKPVLNRSANQ